MHRYLLSLMLGVILLVYLKAEEKPTTNENKPEKTSPEKILNQTITTTLAADTFSFKGKSFFTITAPKTDLKIESQFHGINKTLEFSYIYVESADIGQKIEVFRKGENVIVRRHEKDEEKLLKQAVASPSEYLKMAYESLTNLKLEDDEASDKKPWYKISASLNPDGINNLLALYNRGVMGKAERSSSVKIWVGKEDNLVYKIVLDITILVEPPPNPFDEDEENLPPDKKKPHKTKVVFKGEVTFTDYNKNIDSKVQESINKAFEPEDKNKERE